MKMKKITTTALALLALTTVGTLTSCGGTSNGVERYVVQEVFGNADYKNKEMALTLIDVDTYTFTCRATDSQDKNRVTMDLYMSGSYTREDDIVTLNPGYGYCEALNGDTPIKMPVSEGGAMYFAAIGAQSYTYRVFDGTFEIITE